MGDSEATDSDSTIIKDWVRQASFEWLKSDLIRWAIKQDGKEVDILTARQDDLGLLLHKMDYPTFVALLDGLLKGKKTRGAIVRFETKRTKNKREVIKKVIQELRWKVEHELEALT